MNDIRKLFGNSIFRRLLGTFLLIMVPLYLAGIGIYYWGIQTIRQEMTSSMTSQVVFYVNNLENEMSRIRTLQYDCLNDTDLLKLANLSSIMTDINRAFAILSLQNRLFSIKNSSRYIDDVKVFIPTIGKSISTATTNSVINLELNEYSEIVNFFQNKKNNICYWNEDPYLYAAYPATGDEYQKSPLFVILVKLSVKEINYTLKPIEDKWESSTLLYHHSSGQYYRAAEDDIPVDVLIENVQFTEEKISGTFYYRHLGQSYICIYAKSDVLGMTYVKYVPEGIAFQQVLKYRILLWIYLVISISIIAIFSLSTYRFVHKPLNKLVDAFREVAKGNFKVAIRHDHNDEFRYLYGQFAEMVQDIGELIEKVYMQKLLIQQARLKQLQSQIDPHFLYNSFFVLSTMAQTKDFEYIVEFTEHLGKYFEFVTRDKNDVVELRMEIEHAKSYCVIQTARFSNRIKIVFDDLPEKYENVVVPRLIIQPVIENAYKHGFHNKVAGGSIQVKYLEADSKLKIIIEDTGKGIDDLKMQELQGRLDKLDENDITGLVNIHRRLQLMFGEDCGIRISRNENAGFRVEFIISNIIERKEINAQVVDC